MRSSIISVAVALAVASQTVANPLEKRQSCTGQSCIIAAISGSSGQPINPNTPPKGDTIKGDCCVLSYHPEYASLAYQFRPELKTACSSGASSASTAVARREESAVESYKRDLLALRSAEAVAYVQEEAEAAEAEVEKREPLFGATKCTAKTLLFAKGTFEPGMLGATIGPKLKRALGSEWTVQGVDYQANTAGDYCLGLPGGVKASAALKKLAASCPKTLIALGGYSQGAMVVRDGLANTTLATRVKGILTYGDPFNGAPVKGFSGPIKTYCASGDGVCSGNFEISGAHLSYGGDVDGGAAFLNSL